jgi:hypothetical protein
VETRSRNIYAFTAHVFPWFDADLQETTGLVIGASRATGQPVLIDPFDDRRYANAKAFVNLYAILLTTCWSAFRPYVGGPSGCRGQNLPPAPRAGIQCRADSWSTGRWSRGLSSAACTTCTASHSSPWSSLRESASTELSPCSVWRAGQSHRPRRDPAPALMVEFSRPTGGSFLFGRRQLWASTDPTSKGHLTVY